MLFGTVRNKLDLYGFDTKCVKTVLNGIITKEKRPLCAVFFMRKYERKVRTDPKLL